MLQILAYPLGVQWRYRGAADRFGATITARYQGGPRTSYARLSDIGASLATNPRGGPRQRLSMLTPLGTTYRRLLLDTDLMKLAPARLSGVVLDVGGRRQRRGGCAPPAGAVWIRMNIDPAARPDVIADAHALPVRAEVADCVVCLETLEYVEGPEVAIAEMHRVLRVGGYALVSVPFLHRADSKTDRHRFTNPRLRELCECAGLCVIDIIQQGRFFATLANMLRQATAAVESRPVRWIVASWTVPLGMVLLRLDRLPAVCRSAFLSSFTTGFLAVVRKSAKE